MAKTKEKISLDTIDLVIEHVRKQTGSQESIFRLDKDEKMPEVEAISSGILSLDAALGIFGYPAGRIVEIFGPESSAKTSLALCAVAEAQKKYPEKIAVYLDVENSLDPVWAKKMGVKFEKLVISQPNSAEEALDLWVMIAQTGQASIIVLDSIAALSPQAELEGEMADNTMGLTARLLGKALRKSKSALLKNKTLGLLLNQTRANLSGYGPTEVTPGGLAPKFFSTQRLRTRKAAEFKIDDEIGGIDVEVIVKKNKVAAPFKMAIVPLLFDRGISKELALLDATVSIGLITKAGPWYKYGDTQLAQGRFNAGKVLGENPELMEELYNIYKSTKTGIL